MATVGDIEQLTRFYVVTGYGLCGATRAKESLNITEGPVRWINRNCVVNLVAGIGRVATKGIDRFGRLIPRVLKWIAVLIEDCVGEQTRVAPCERFQFGAVASSDGLTQVCP